MNSKEQEIKLGVVESQFADIIWENEPLSSTYLVKLCNEKLEWKKSTTYTVLRKLCDRGIFRNENGIVSSVINKDEFYALQSEKFVDETFKGSLPAFFAAFTKRKSLSLEEIEQIQKMIDEHKEG
ncbi:MAG: BlaI/MecI/CopY family transcriptional regulator [Lachnospiraceae bacterium]|nr:BlaI/MecI/CopY family transcriptional regulator [Lachnospiraceae bacterium]